MLQGVHQHEFIAVFLKMSFKFGLGKHMVSKECLLSTWSINANVDFDNVAEVVFAKFPSLLLSILYYLEW